MSDDRQTQYRPTEVSPPGETLRELLAEKGMSQANLADRMGRPKKTISEIVRGQATITAETALQLELSLGVSASFWNARERRYREHLARVAQEARFADLLAWTKSFPLAAMTKAGLIANQGTPAAQVHELLGFFGVSSPEEWNTVYGAHCVAFRRALKFETSHHALAAWLRAGELDAEAIGCAPFDKAVLLDALRAARSLTRRDPKHFHPVLVEQCAAAGVAVVFRPQLPKCRVSGATRWLTPQKALIQLSLRYKTDDHLWFTFFHEAAHVLLHAKKVVFLEGSATSVVHDADEEEADSWAAEFLIPQDQLNDFSARGPLSKDRIRSFARDLGIAPGIVVGRLQHQQLLPHNHCNGLKQRLEWVA